MPCYDPRDSGGGVEYVDVRVNGLTAKQLDAILCGVLDVDRQAVANLRPGQLLWDLVDWKEVGLPRTVAEKWHENHKKTDELRRKREEDEARARAARRSGLRKLTYEERKALGVQ